MTFLPKVSGIITSDAPLEDKIGAISDAYLAILKENPQLPMFLMKEAMRDNAVPYNAYRITYFR